MINDIDLVITELSQLIDKSKIIVDAEALKPYGSDHTEDFCFPPNVVVKPETTAEVSAIMQWAYAHEITVIPIGARTGLSGGILATQGGVGLSLERMNEIIHIDKNNLQVITQPGVITEVLQNAVAQEGLFYPVDPASKGSCFIGGNVAENAGGARAVKYGVTKDYVLNLEVVLPNGEIIWTGVNTLKNATGYNLTQLMVGSEGTLGVITKIVLKLIPQQKLTNLLLVPFLQMDEATTAVAEIFKAGVVPSAMEFMEMEAIRWTTKFMEAPELNLLPETEALLLIEIDGNDAEVMFAEAEKLMEILTRFSIGEVIFAETEEHKNTIWKMRRNISEAVKTHSVYKEVDTVVPRYELTKLLKSVKEIGDKYGFKSVCYGHAGDGNLHVNIVKDNMSDEQWKNVVPKGVKEIFELTVQLGGTLSGEHGIGWVQRNFMSIAFSPIQLELMKGIKKLFDPKNIMNPGKIFPDNH